MAKLNFIVIVVFIKVVKSEFVEASVRPSVEEFIYSVMPLIMGS
jgi:hypothetical protein